MSGRSLPNQNVPANPHFFLSWLLDAHASVSHTPCLPPPSRYATVDDAIKMVVANKTDLAGRRDVSTEEGHDLAKKHGWVMGPAFDDEAECRNFLF